MRGSREHREICADVISEFAALARTRRVPPFRSFCLFEEHLEIAVSRPQYKDSAAR